MNTTYNKSTEAFNIKRALDIRADQLNEKFKQLFFSSLNYKKNTEGDLVKIKNRSKK